MRPPIMSHQAAAAAEHDEQLRRRDPDEAEVEAEEEEEEEEQEEFDEDELQAQEDMLNDDVYGECHGERHERCCAVYQADRFSCRCFVGSDSISDSGTDSLTWISWFCSLPGHEYFAEVSEEFIEDDFNLTGLNGLVPFYKEALEMILDVEPQEDSLKIPDVSIVESSAELLYGLIHQRYILTKQGLQQMVSRQPTKVV